MSEIVKRMARTYIVGRQTHYREAFKSEMLGWGDVSDKERDGICAGIRAAIAAMREPTADMLQALIVERERADIVCGVRWEKATVLSLWEVAVDAALAPA